MNFLRITGGSDDLIEVEGAIDAEWQAYDTDKESPKLIAISDGTLLRIWDDDDGIWRIVVVTKGEGSTVDHVHGDMQADTFDVVTIRGESFEWVVLGTHHED